MKDEETCPSLGWGGGIGDGDHFLSSRRTTETLRKSVDAPAQQPGCIFELARGDGRSPGG